ncbi:hypothetical protein [Peredibacter starrii]|uniref:HNH endonuclease n=1 Tax=Peredibacter starrii TaxID=28202 RepID=A0AAX4HJ85_9BACT|nr:hypothetical protein [Peredibacter starrii]WPU63292.1 hypothetical protein SOO65_11410 [Peredibacter starrii]
MKRIAVLALTLFTLTANAAVPMAYPKNPDPRLTPGSLCDHADSYRYPEQIAYCERAVNSFTKEAIFISYRNNLGYRLSGDRATFKIDHFIPLCAGGSNLENNLWPQHVSVYKITDPVESVGCEKLSQGLIKQAELVDLIRTAKLNLAEAPKIFKYLKSLR